MSKHRILIMGDTSTAMSGFACYKKNLLLGLYKSNKYEIAELGFAGTNQNKNQVPWQYYPTNPEVNTPEFQQFSKDPEARYGKLRWEKVLLHFKPTLVISPTDPWQMMFTTTSPLRKYYHLCMSPTVDSDPQKNEYIAIFHNADTLITYTEYGKKVLENAGLKVTKSIGMGIDPDIFKPIPDKENFRNNLGIRPDAIIFGFVARNQPRKRIPELLRAFRVYLDTVNAETRKRSYLYLHTTYPDKAWHIPRNLIELDLYNNVYFTYFCEKTKHWFPSLFKDKMCYSPLSNELSGRFNHVMAGLPEFQLNEVYNLFDLYIQYATNEGFGAPMVEAAACNIPLAGINHSSMTEVITNCGGDLLQPITTQEDWNVQANKAVMDIDALARYMVEFAYDKKDNNYRQRVLDNYTWDKCIQQWIEIIDNIPVEDRWDESPIPIENINIKQQYDNYSQFIRELVVNTNDPWGYNTMNDIKQINHRGFLLNDGNWLGINEQFTLNKYQQIYQLKNNVEFARLNQESITEEEWQK